MPSPRSEHRPRIALRWLASGALLALCAAALVARSARWWWPGEILVNFSWQTGWLALACALALLLLRAPRRALLAAVLALALLVPALSLWWPRASSPPSSAGAQADASVELELACANLLYAHPRPEAFRAWVEREQPDFIALLEVCRAWLPIVESLGDLYPHRVLLPERLDPTRIESFGPAVVSRLPLRDVRVLDLVAGQQPVIELALELPDGAGALHVTVAHPSRPGRAARTAMRNASLRALADTVDFGARSVLLADLNCTLYSPAFGDLCERTGLRSARQGYGREASWRSDRWISGLWLDLDHALVGEALEVADFYSGPGFGSDHLPIVARVRVPREPVAWQRAARPLHATPQALLPEPR